MADIMHDALHGDLEDAREMEATLVAIKLDLMKCFDKVGPDQAIYVWERLGAPKEVTAVLRDFYGRYARWIEYKGAVHPEPLWPDLSIIQGMLCFLRIIGGTHDSVAPRHTQTPGRWSRG